MTNGTTPYPAEPWPDCARCEDEYLSQFTDARRIMRRMLLCPECGNKRCPKATWHEQACTGSNDTGQEGSRYA